MDAFQKLSAELGELSNADLLALHDEAHADPAMDGYSLPLRKALYAKYRTQMIDLYITSEICKRWTKQVRGNSKSA